RRYENASAHTGLHLLLCGGAPPPPPVPSRLRRSALLQATVRLVNGSVSDSPVRLCLRGFRRSALRSTTVRLRDFLSCSPLDFPLSHLAMLVLLVAGGDSPTQINRRQQHEDERLERRGYEPQEHHGQRYEKRDDAEENEDDQLLAEDVAKEPQRQREDAREMTDDLDRQHDRREK